MRTGRAPAIHARHPDAAPPTVSKALFARSVTVLTLEVDPFSSPEEVEDAYFRTFVARFPNLRLLNLKRWYPDNVLEHLLFPVAFSDLTTLSLGCEYDAMLTVVAFFEMLHAMPALKKLSMGMVVLPDDLYEDDIARELCERSLLQPACRLTHLVVNDGEGVDFRYYPLLLSRSHDTLEHVALHGIFDAGVGNYVREALLRCTRVRHLSLEGNSFDNQDIISACPRLQSLVLTTAPGEAEMTALQAPLRALQLTNYFGHTPEDFVAYLSGRLCDIILDSPSLGTICFDFVNRQLQRETKEYRKLRALCKERRIHLSTVPPPRVIYLCQM